MSFLPGALRERVERIIRGDAAPGALYIPLAAAEAFYSLAAAARNGFYKAGVLRPGRAPVKVISAGALTVGGAGKTPFAALLARKLMAKKPGVLSRGYGGRFPGSVYVVSDGRRVTGDPPPVSADEPYMLALKLPGVPVVLAPRRIEGARLMAEKLGVETIILDDGFQHRAIHRDLDILLLDAGLLRRGVRLLPLGPLREPLSAAGRADVIVVTGVSTDNDDGFAELAEAIRRTVGGEKTIAAVSGSITGFASLDGELREKPGGSAFVFSGVADPGRFARSLSGAGVRIAGSLSFPDHHMFTREDVDRIVREKERTGAEFIVTTEKDGVRLLRSAGRLGPELLLAVYEMRITSGEKALDEALASALG
ncbi:MAG: tetraacyldisaccharide 4'-kinase [Candidatus Nitrospinota bacterium M3_3B_026]